jgi:hypothetical protein
MFCVTQCCPATSMPHWFREKEKRVHRAVFGLCSLRQPVYQLPKLSEVTRPMPIWEFYD